MDFKDNDMLVECENGFEMYCLCCDQTIASSPANLRNHLATMKHLKSEEYFHKDTEIALLKNEIESLKAENERLKFVPDELLKAEVEAEKQPLLDEIERLSRQVKTTTGQLLVEKQRRENSKLLRHEHKQELVKREEFWKKIRVENNNLKDEMLDMKEQIEGDQVHKQNAQKTIAELREIIKTMVEVGKSSI